MFCVIFLANYTNYTNKSNKHVFIIILLDVYLKVHLLEQLPGVQYLSTLNVGVRPKKYRTSSIFWLYFMQECTCFWTSLHLWPFYKSFFLCFLPCKKARPKHTVLEGFLAFFYKKKFTELMPKSLNSMILGSVR